MQFSVLRAFSENRPLAGSFSQLQCQYVLFPCPGPRGAKPHPPLPPSPKKIYKLANCPFCGSNDAGEKNKDRCYYPHWSSDSLSLVYVIFLKLQFSLFIIRRNIKFKDMDIFHYIAYLNKLVRILYRLNCLYKAINIPVKICNEHFLLHILHQRTLICQRLLHSTTQPIWQKP